MAKDILGLLQLADACFPSGGFAFSNGLESLAKLGYVKRMSDFRQYLECHLDSVTSAEIPFFNSAFSQAGPPPGREFAGVAREWDAWVFLPTQRRGSLAQGQAWSRAMEEAYGLDGLLSLRPWFLRERIPMHFLMVFAASLKAVGIGPEDGQNLLLHMALRDQLGAAVRLGMLGSLQAQKLHREFIGIGEGYRKMREDWDLSRSVRAAPMIDLAQSSHAYLYSKLFQS